MKSVYKTPQIKQKVGALTKKFRSHIKEDIKDHYLETSYGKTYVAEIGDSLKQTVVILHGGMTNHAFILYFLRNLIGKYHIICPDMPRHAGYSTEQPIDPRGDDYGHWAIEILDKLNIKEAAFVGTSYGGFVANRVIALAPERVKKAVLIVPAGIVGMSNFSLFRYILLWQILYTLTGSEMFFRKIMDVIFTDCPDKDVEDFFRLTLTGIRMDARPMKLSSKDDTSGFDKPIYIIAAEDDIIFDCKALKTKVESLYPHARFDLLAGSKHSPSITTESIDNLNVKIIEFLEKR